MATGVSPARLSRHTGSARRGRPALAAAADLICNPQAPRAAPLPSIEGAAAQCGRRSGQAAPAPPTAPMAGAGRHRRAG